MKYLMEWFISFVAKHTEMDWLDEHASISKSEMIELELLEVWSEGEVHRDAIH